MGSWKPTTLRELLKVEHGYAFKGEYFSDAGHYVVLTPGNFYEEGGFKLRPGKDRYYVGEIPDRYILPKGSMIVAMTEQAEGLLGSPAMMPESNRFLHNQRLGLVRPFEKKADLHFLYHLFNTQLIRQQLRNSSSGAKVRHTSPERIYRSKVTVPDVPTQRKIAAILTAYDDLIEVNKRRIALLEKMAEEIYREWFVRLRFPGYQHTLFVKGVPEGWEVVELRDICEEVSRSTRPGNHLSDRFYLPLDSLATKQMLPIDHYDYTAAQSSLALFDKGDILFGAMRPYQHKVVIAPFNGVTRTTMFVIRPKEDYLLAYSYLNLFQCSSIEYATLICNGADRPYVVWNRGMERMQVFLPSKEILIKFEEIAGPILKSIREYYFIQRKLAETRDLLLPRLISGKLAVEDLDIQFPPSMQNQMLAPANADEDSHA